ncbi:hypothetical protein AA103196_0980 [Ameyamaea chiangmaiensis NBRC 103196]|nr:hypothetical protein AA103196_0980 [Ameyamaea chiangmaiensis NBRC 103196]
MAPDGILVSAPSLNDRADVGEVSEQMLVKALVPQQAVEVPDEPVLLRLGRYDIVPQHRPFFQSSHDRVRGPLGAIVADDHHRKDARFPDPVVFPNDDVSATCAKATRV